MTDSAHPGAVWNWGLNFWQFVIDCDKYLSRRKFLFLTSYNSLHYIFFFAISNHWGSSMHGCSHRYHKYNLYKIPLIAPLLLIPPSWLSEFSCLPPLFQHSGWTSDLICLLILVITTDKQVLSEAAYSLQVISQQLHCPLQRQSPGQCN